MIPGLLVLSALLLGGCSGSGSSAANEPAAESSADSRSAAEGAQETKEEETEDLVTVSNGASEAVSVSEGASESAEVSDYDISSENIKVYYEGQFGSEEEELEMYFLNDNKQIAYYDMDTVCHIMNRIYQGGYGDYEKDPDYELTWTADENVVTFLRESGYDMILDFDQDTARFTDFDCFICHSYDMTTVDLSHSSGYDEEGKPVYLQRVEERSYSRFGKEMLFDLDSYDIDLVMQDGHYYIPAQTMADILIGSTYTLYLYNGEEAFYVNYANFGEDCALMEGAAEEYYSVTGVERTQELIDYTYNELCMVLDYSYGLKETHSIEDFDDYFEEVAYDSHSLKELLRSTDPVQMEQALWVLTLKAFDDLHSNYAAPSAYTGIDQMESIYSVGYGTSVLHYMSVMQEYRNARAEAVGTIGGSIPGYEEIGDTAFVTFDSFRPVAKDYYAQPPQSEEDVADTVGLLIYAHSMITRENSPIKNIVMDLSCNSGGAEDAVAFVCAWFLGEADIYLANPVTDASSVSVYRCDANLDHVFDEKDTVSDYNLYCLISPASFSCGNLAPCMFDCSGKVTLIGKTSGGGSCVVLPLTTASGSFFQISGFRRVSSMKNGSFYNADQGIDPDIELTKLDSFYDREGLVKYLHELK